jgi:hypothetical protein
MAAGIYHAGCERCLLTVPPLTICQGLRGTDSKLRPGIQSLSPFGVAVLEGHSGVCEGALGARVLLFLPHPTSRLWVLGGSDPCDHWEVVGTPLSQVAYPGLPLCFPFISSLALVSPVSGYSFFSKLWKMISKTFTLTMISKDTEVTCHKRKTI